MAGTLDARRPPAWLVAGALSVLLVTVVSLSREPFLQVDTGALVAGAHSIIDCLDAGIRSSCNDWPGDGDRGVSSYPLLQHVPALPAVWAGLSDDGVYRLLSSLNALAYAGLAALLVLVGLRTGRRWAPPLLLLLAVASPLPWYAGATFGEMLATLCIAAFFAAAVLRWHPLVLLALLVLAGWSKETIFPFLLVGGAAGLWLTPIATRPLRRGHWVALGAGVVAVVVTNLGLNWFRYGQLTNESYTQEMFRVDDVGVQVRYFVSLWLAPNGGVVEFWPVAALLFAGVAAALLRGRRLAAAVVLGLLVAHTASLSAWWQPFGWNSWGPRLMLPLLPGLAILAVALAGDQIERALAWLGRSALRVGAVAALLVVLTLPHAGIVWSSEALVTFFAPLPAPTEKCPADSAIQQNKGHYFGCTIDAAWRRDPILPDAVDGVKEDWGPVHALLTSVAVVLLVVAAARPPRITTL